MYNLTQPILTTNTENEVEILTMSRNALITYEQTFYSAVRSLGYDEGTICKLISTVRVDSTTQILAMVVRKGSPFREFFNSK